MDRLKGERGPEAAAPGEEPPRRGRDRAAAGAAPGAPAPRGAQRSRLRLGGRGAAARRFSREADGGFVCWTLFCLCSVREMVEESWKRIENIKNK